MHHHQTIVIPFVFLAQKIIMVLLEHIISLELSMVKIRLAFISNYTQYHTQYYTKSIHRGVFKILRRPYLVGCELRR